MLDELWSSASDILGEGLSSLLESLLNATVFKLFYYLESALCWLVGMMMDLFEVFAGLEPVTYNGKQSYLINVFFSNKAISNIYWGMAIIGMVLIFAFTGWAVIRKMFDIDGKQQQSIGQIVWSAVKSLFLIIGLTLVVNVVISATSILMRQVDYIFNNAYHLDQPQERDFTDEEYAAMGRVLSTIGNYAMIPNANNRYNLNLCFNDIRQDMLLLQEQGVFDYSYYKKDGDGNVIESWQLVLSRIAKSANLTQDVKIDVYNEGVARSITEAMDYLRSNSKPQALSHIEASYTVTERAHLDRMIFLLGTFRAAHNRAYNEHPAFDDAVRGPYFYAQDRSIYEYDQVIEDFDIGFKTDYLLVWLAAFAVLFNLLIIILNCVARIFNLMLLYVIAPPFIASSPLDNGGKFKQWTTAFIIQSLSVFGTVIAMQLLLIYLPIVASPDLVLFKDRPLLNAIAQFMLIFGGIEAAKKAGSLVTGILADQAGMEAIRSGDMSSSAGRLANSATNAAKGALGVAAGVAGFALSPVTNLVKRPFKALGDGWRKLGSGGRQARAEKAVQEEIEKNKAIEKFRKSGHPDAKYLGSGGGGDDGNRQNEKNKFNVDDANRNVNNQNPGTGNQTPPPVPKGKTGGHTSFEAEDAGRRRPRDASGTVGKVQNKGFNETPAVNTPAREMNATSNRPTLDKPPAAPVGERNRNEAGPGNGQRPAGDAPMGQGGNRQQNMNNRNQPLRGNRFAGGAGPGQQNGNMDQPIRRGRANSLGGPRGNNGNQNQRGNQQYANQQGNYGNNVPQGNRFNNPQGNPYQNQRGNFGNNDLQGNQVNNAQGNYGNNNAQMNQFDNNQRGDFGNNAPQGNQLNNAQGNYGNNNLQGNQADLANRNVNAPQGRFDNATRNNPGNADNRQPRRNYAPQGRRGNRYNIPPRNNNPQGYPVNNITRQNADRPQQNMNQQYQAPQQNMNQPYQAPQQNMNQQYQAPPMNQNQQGNNNNNLPGSFRNQ